MVEPLQGSRRYKAMVQPLQGSGGHEVMAQPLQGFRILSIIMGK